MSKVKTKNPITLTVQPTDGPAKTRSFADLKLARAFAHAMVGEDAGIKEGIAHGMDGATLTGTGLEIATLFESPAKPKTDAKVADPEAPKAPCLCGCGATPSGKKAIFIPGHDAKLKGVLLRVVRGQELKSDPTPSIEQTEYGMLNWAHLIAFPAEQLAAFREKIGF